MVTVEEGLRSQLRNIEATYGRPIDSWIDVIRASGRSRHGEIVAMLKAEHGISHGAAHRLALLAIDTRGSDAGLPASDDPAAGWYAGGKASLRPIHEELMAVIRALGDDVDVVPKKGYLSLRCRRQFAMIKPAARHIDLGLVLRGREATGRLESAATFNALFTHRVRVSRLEDIDGELRAYLEAAYREAK